MPATPLPEAVVFDLDGTLVDSLDDLAEAVNRTLTAFDLPPVSPDVVRTRVGRGASHLVQASIGDRVAFEDAIEVFLEAYRGLMTRQTRPFAGLPEVLDALGARGVLRAVATNKPAAFTGPVLEATDLARRLEGWASGDESARKPDPASLVLALERAGHPGHPAGVVYVGDMPVDVRTGRAFGSRVIGVRWGFDPNGCEAEGPDLMCGSAEDLGRALGL